jgi:hypothetical protein
VKFSGFKLKACWSALLVAICSPSALQNVTFGKPPIVQEDPTLATRNTIDPFPPEAEEPSAPILRLVHVGFPGDATAPGTIVKTTNMDVIAAVIERNSRK